MKKYVDKDKLQEFATKLHEKQKTIFATQESIAPLVGSPLVASTAAEMTDTTKIYVYVGSETGYTSGNWYYYDGSAWQSGGVYNSTAFETDDTLSIAGAAADAKATGDRIRNNEATEKNIVKTITPAYDASNLTVSHSYISPSTGKWAGSTYNAFCYFIPVPEDAKLFYIAANSDNRAIYALLSDSAHTSNTDPSYADGFSGRQILNAGETIVLNLPENCHYIWLAEELNAVNYYPDFFGFELPNIRDVAKIPNIIERLDSLYPGNLYAGDWTVGTIKVEDGTTLTSTNGRYSDYVNIEEYENIIYSRITTAASSAIWGMTFYDENKEHIANTGEGPVLNADTTSFILSKIAVPSGAVYARFTWTSSLDINNFIIFDAAMFENSKIVRLQEEIDVLKKYHPDYSGKKVSILGDSISTFCAAEDKVDGKAPAGCVTNFPGNVVKYSFSDVTSVDKTWWKQVIDYFGMTLGINESWAGSTIGFNSNYTDSGKYTADNCMCSETRINHLDDNGTPDIILVFGGTNDINHHKDGSHTRFAVGSLDGAHNPYDFDNFPIVTDTYYGAITTMLLRLQHTYPNAKILMVLPYFCTYTHTSATDVATPYDQYEWSKAAIDVCDFLGVDYVDLRTIINLYDVSSLLADGLHPKYNGMTAIANAVIHKLNEML